jgi:hypothetical protein
MTTRSVGLFLALAAVAWPLAAAQKKPVPNPEADAAPAVIKGGDVFKLLETAQVPANESIDGSVVVIGSQAIIEGKVSQDVVVVGGSAFVTGTIGGDVVVVGPNVDLGPRSEIGHDFVAIGSTVRRSPGSKVLGKSVTLHGLRILAMLATLASLLAFTSMWIKLFSVVGWLLLAAVVGALVSKPLRDSSAMLRRRPVGSLVLGLLFWPSLTFLFAALVVSILGLPLTPLLAVGAGLVCLWGYLAAGQWLGEAVLPRVETRWLPCFVGVGLLQIAAWVPFGRGLDMLALVFGIGASLLWLASRAASAGKRAA